MTGAATTTMSSRRTSTERLRTACARARDLALCACRLHRPPAALARRLPEVHRGRLPGRPATEPENRRPSRLAPQRSRRSAGAGQPGLGLQLRTDTAPAAAAHARSRRGPASMAPGSQQPPALETDPATNIAALGDAARDRQPRRRRDHRMRVRIRHDARIRQQRAVQPSPGSGTSPRRCRRMSPTCSPQAATTSASSRRTPAGRASVPTCL